MKYLKLLLLGLINLLVFLLSDSDNKNSNTKQITWLDNPDSDPLHDGDWEDYNGDTYSKNIDGNHYDQSGSKWEQ